MVMVVDCFHEAYCHGGSVTQMYSIIQIFEYPVSLELMYWCSLVETKGPIIIMNFFCVSQTMNYCEDNI